MEMEYRSSGVCEIEEEEVDTNSNIEEDHQHVYVAVGNSNTSMNALSWTLNNLATQSTIIFLLHVFPQINHIPNPLGVGMVPRNQVSAAQVESYIDQEKAKISQLLHKFIQSCSTSKVKVDTILIESDSVAKAIVDLIPILQIANLVIGANKIRKSKSRKGNSIADQILRNAPKSCKVRIICEGNEVIEHMISPSPLALTTHISANATSITSKKRQDRQHDSVSCICFIPKFK